VITEQEVLDRSLYLKKMVERYGESFKAFDKKQRKLRRSRRNSFNHYVLTGSSRLFDIPFTPPTIDQIALKQFYNIFRRENP